MAQVVAERPVLQQERGDERERDAEQRHEQVADGHVHDEQVGDGVHLRGEHHHVAHQPVAGQRHAEHRGVHQVDERPERGRAERAVRLGVTRERAAAAAATAGHGAVPVRVRAAVRPPVARRAAHTRVGRVHGLGRDHGHHPTGVAGAHAAVRSVRVRRVRRAVTTTTTETAASP